MLECAMRDHTKIVKIMSTKRDMLTHSLKFWLTNAKRKGEDLGLQSTLDALSMMTDSNSMYDILDATFAKGLRVHDLSMGQVK